MRFRPSPSTLIALAALFVALGGPAQAAKLISGSSIKKNSVTSKQLKNGSIVKRDLSSRVVGQLQRTPDNSIGSFQLKNGAVTGAKLAPASVGGAAIADGTLSGADLAPQSILNGALAADTVGNVELQDNAVGKSNVRVGAIGKSEIGANGVGTEEVIDNDLRLTDMAVFFGLAQGIDFSSTAPSRCTTADVPTAAFATDLSNAALIVNQPVPLPDGLILSGRFTTVPTATTAGTIRLSACNLSDQPVDPTTVTVSYLAFT